MKNYTIITVIICLSVSAATFAGVCSLNAVAESGGTGQIDSSCSDELRQSMAEMHHEMMAVETSGNVL